MSSPAEIPFRSFIKIDRGISKKIYLQITDSVINAIQDGILPSGIKLPGTRSMAELLQLHRKTVVAAYAELEAQGWITTIPNKGTYVAETKKRRTNVAINLSNADKSHPQKAGYVFKKSFLLDTPFEFQPCEYILDDGQPDIRLTQFDKIASFYTANLKRRSNRKKMGHFNSEGGEYLKVQLASYLNQSRGLHVSPENLLITRSTEMSVYIISEILLSAGETVIVGELSYFAVNMIFQKSGARIQTVPVDHDGIDVDRLEMLCQHQKVRMVYVTPHHHYPTTVTLSVERREKLLALSEKFGFVILEDDYDYEFRYDLAPVLPIASKDDKGMVIYTGSFGKSLAPGFRMGFVVAPQDITKEMQKQLGIIDRQGDIMMEQALGEMIEEGEIHRYWRKSLKVYEARRNHCVQMLVTELGDVLHFNVPNGGLAIWAKWSSQVPTNLSQLSLECKRRGLFIPKTLLYQSKSYKGMRIGFGQMNEGEMRTSLQIINDAVRGY